MGIMGYSRYNTGSKNSLDYDYTEHSIDAISYAFIYAAQINSLFMKNCCVTFSIFRKNLFLGCNNINTHFCKSYILSNGYRIHKTKNLCDIYVVLGIVYNRWVDNTCLLCLLSTIL